MDSEKFFTSSLDSLLNHHGFNKVSFDVYPNRFTGRYNYIHRDRRGNQVAVSLIVITGVAAGELLACFGHIVKSPLEEPIEPIRTKLRLRGNMDEILNQFKHQFIYRLKDALSPRITELPNEVLYHLLEYLSVKDVVNLMKVNHSWYRLLNDDYIWRKIYYASYGENIDVGEYRSDGTALCYWRDLVIQEFNRRKELRLLQELSGRGLPAPTIFLALPPTSDIYPRAIEFRPSVGPLVLWRGSRLR